MRIAIMLTSDVGMRSGAQVYLLTQWLRTALSRLAYLWSFDFTLEAFQLLYRNSPCLR